MKVSDVPCAEFNGRPTEAQAQARLSVCFVNPVASGYFIDAEGGGPGGKAAGYLVGQIGIISGITYDTCRSLPSTWNS